METRIIVSGVIENKGKYLFGKKPKSKGPYPDTWHLLCGGLKDDETLADALKREVREESGIEISNIRQISFGEDIEPNKHGVDTHYIFLVFKADYKSGNLNPRDDIIELKWIDKSSLAKTKLNRPTIKLFKKLGLIS